MSDLKSMTVVILGQKGTGKTTLYKQFYKFFKVQYPTTTRNHGRMVVCNDKARVTILDVSVPFMLAEICLQTFWKEADVFMLVYAINDNSSFEYIAQMKDALMRPKSKNTPTITVVGNKKDLDTRAMRHEVADCIVTIDWKLNYLEMSALYEDAEDAVPRIMRSLIPRTRLTPIVPAGDGFDALELRGTKYRRRSSTVTETKRRQDPLDGILDGITEEVDLPISLLNGRARRRLSLPSNLSRWKVPAKTDGSDERSRTSIDHAPRAKRPSLISQLLLCVKDNREDLETFEDLEILDCGHGNPKL